MRPLAFARLLPAALLLSLLIPGSAIAGEVDAQGSGVRFEAADGEANRLLVSASAGDFEVPNSSTITFFDTAEPVVIDENVDSECTQVNANTVQCTGNYFYWGAYLGDENDEVTAAGTLGGELGGGPGSDTLRGSNDATENFEFLGGGDGDDQLFGNGGDDILDGGEGTDRAQAGDGDDTATDYGGDGTDNYDGGPGIDSADYFGNPTSPLPDAITVDLTAGTGGRTNNGPETDTLVGFEDTGGGGMILASAGVLGVQEPSPMTLRGSAEPNHLGAGPADDNLTGLGSADTLEAREGNDTIDARDGSADRVLCGPGFDTALIDQLDQISGCENAPVEQRRAEAADQNAPDCVIRKVKKSYGSGAFLKGFTARVRCDEAARLNVQLVAALRSGQLRGAKVGDLVLAQRSARVAGGSKATKVRVKPAKKFARRLARRKAFKVRLVVDATDQYGNRDRGVKRVKVAKPKRRKK